MDVGATVIVPKRLRGGTRFSRIFDSAAKAWLASERTSRTLTTRFLEDLSWTRLYDSFSWKRWTRKSHEVFILNLITKTNSVLSAQWFVRLNHERIGCEVLSASAKRVFFRVIWARRVSRCRTNAAILFGNHLVVGQILTGTKSPIDSGAVVHHFCECFSQSIGQC